MEQENLNGVSDENTAADFCGIQGLLVRAGLCVVKFLAAILLGIVKTAAFFLHEAAAFLGMVKKTVKWLIRQTTASIRRRHAKNKELQKAVIKAKSEGKREYMSAIARFTASYLFGEDGIVPTAINYIAPIVSAAFLIGIVNFGSGLEYGISVSYNGKEIGMIASEADYEQAEREVIQRMSNLSDSDSLRHSAELSLKIVSGGDKFLSADQLANVMLESSDEELAEAYGIYIDGDFIGAVTDKNPIQDALDNRLLNFHAEGDVSNISYRNKIEYTKGLYLVSSIMEQEAAVSKLTSSEKKRKIYVAVTGDSAVTISQKYNMKLDELYELNPDISEGVTPGQMINVTETESFLPIQYVLRATTVTFLDYETIEYETASLNVGARAVLVKGIKGEKTSDIEITYVDGVEHSRRTVHSEITREPVVEQIGIGTYSARPDSPDTILTGSGEFGWPVDGGYVSDPFISNRNHKGLDIAAPEGTNIYAAGDGIVIAAGWNPGGYGYFVEIDHLNGYQTVYAHMSMVFASEGQTVTRGQLIGAVGNTGYSNGAHCHLEVRYLNVCLDPAAFINTVNAFSDDDDEDSSDK